MFESWTVDTTTVSRQPRLALSRACKFASATAVAALVVSLSFGPASADVSGERLPDDRDQGPDRKHVITRRQGPVEADRRECQETAEGNVAGLPTAAKQSRQEFTGVKALLDACAAAFPNDRRLGAEANR